MTDGMAEDRWAGTTWRIEMVGDQVIAGEATMAFEDGRIFGRSVINRYFGSYEARGDRLSLGPLGSTLMAGPPEAMAEERVVMAALSGELTVDPESPDGAVVLQGTTPQGTTTLRLVEVTPPQPA